MSLMEAIRSAYSSLMANKSRSILTMLGVIIGVASVLIVVAIGEGLKTDTLNRIRGMGANLLTIRPGGGDQGFRTSRPGRLTDDDARAIQEQARHISAVAPVVQTNGNAKYRNLSHTTGVVGATTVWPKVMAFEIAHGRFLTTSEERARSRVAVLGQEVVNELFYGRPLVGEFIRMYLVRNARWTSPLFLCGESYGTFRSAGIAGALADKGIIFCSMSEAIKDHPELVRQYLGTVVPVGDNYFAALNSAVFSDGSFVFIPAGVRCPMELSTYFRINAGHTGQFERTLIVCEDKGYVSYLEGCTAPMRDENQLHAAVVELVALDDAEIKYSTVQNWYPGDEEGRGGIYNFVTKRAECRGARSKVVWAQVETGSAITWKYPSCVLLGDDSSGEFHSVALTHHRQQADTGTKMIHVGKRTKSKIVSKGISAGRGQNTYRGLVKVAAGAEGARNYTQCDSLLIGKKCGAHTFPYIEVKNPGATVEHEATTSKISDDQLFYCRARGISEEDAVSLIVDGFCKQVFKELPMEFAVEAKKLLDVSLEGSVG